MKREEEEQVAVAKVKIGIQSHEDGRVSFYRVARDTPLKILFKAYCKQVDLVYPTVRFLYDLQRINSKKSANQLGLQDDDVIDAMPTFTGGGALHP